MSGIKKISEARASDNSGGSGGGIQIWLRLKNGDDAQVKIIPSGEDSDNRLDDLYLHTIEMTRDDGKKTYKTIYCLRQDNSSCDCCASGSKAQHQFAFWTYVYFILHTDKKDPTWESVTNRQGDVRYMEKINDFRMFSRGFGKGDYLWNQLVNISSEVDLLSDNIIRIQRKGATRDDTTYTFTLTAKKAELLPDDVKKAKSLPNIKPFFKGEEKWPPQEKPESLNDEDPNSEEKSSNEEEELF